MAGEFKRLAGIAPWGRRLREYRAFFVLDEAALSRPVLDVGAGPSSFVAEVTAAGGRAVAADPLYTLANDAIAGRFEETVPLMRAAMQEARERFNWNTYGSATALEALRREALGLFLKDRARAQERYVAGALPALPFAEKQFGIALVSHLLFLYGDDLDFAFHIAAIKELARVAEEVRIFPLFNLDGRPSSHLPCVVKHLRAEGYACAEVRVHFEFQLGARTMLQVKR
ncbi:hypothetical protein ACSHT0_01455 [Tepidicaulis sp. LMO-SS28]|uniref:hypothetical protein n=1 Tax=Tepidicaulis sp. LMO-SS28 TaxID=3447455 RepID=UPI003EE0C08B